MKYHKLFALAVFTSLLSPRLLLAQDFTGIPGLSEVTFSDSGRTVRAHVYLGEQKVRAKPDCNYAWVKSGKLFTSQGGYSGKLLDGPFHEFYPSKNLYVQGNYRLGLKQGVWKAWREDGHLKEVIIWTRGVKNGPFAEYDSLGRLTVKGSYRYNILNGTLTQIDSTGHSKVSNYTKGKSILNTKRSSYHRLLRYLKKQFHK